MEVQFIIKYDTETGAFRVGHPDNMMLCDHMLAEARRILDRADAKKRAPVEKSYEGRILVPPPLTGG